MVDKAASIALGCQLIICSRSAYWWDEELRQLEKGCRICFAQDLINDSNWNDYRKKLKLKFKEERRFVERNQ